MARKPRTFVVGRGSMKSLAQAVELAPQTTIIIPPGVYHDQMVLQNDVTFDISEGAVIDYDVQDGKPTVTTNGQTITNCTLTGAGTVKRSNSQAPVILIDNDSQISIVGGPTIIDSGLMTNGAIQQLSGSLTFNGTISTQWCCIWSKGGVLNASGVFSAVKDHAVFIGGAESQAILSGNIRSEYNCGLGVANGSCEFTGGSIFSQRFYAAEYSGGQSFIIRNARIESAANGGKEVGDAVQKYGGLTMELDNCDMFCFHPEAFSISAMGRADTVTLLSDCRANRPKTPEITVTGPGQLILTP